MALLAIQEKLGNLVNDTWADDMQSWGERVKLYRDYAEGNHRAKMTAEMKALLRVSGDQTDQFNDNYCDMVVQSMNDRLTVDAIRSDDDAANDWSAGLLRENRFDGLQMDVHEAAIRDGDTFVLLSYDNDESRVRMTHEPAYDGSEGMFVVYDRQRRGIEVAVKIWEISEEEKQVNLYYRDHIEKYISDISGESLKLMEEAADPSIKRNEEGHAIWKAGVIPVMHFRNRANQRTTRGVSELAAIIPLQDGLNRTFTSMVMVSELSAFQIKIALGFYAPANLSPGMWVEIAPDGLSKDQVADAKVMEQAQLVPFINQANFIINQMGSVSRTPLPQLMGGDSQSGEALKQREVGLLGKISRFHVRAGNVWEDGLSIAQKIQMAYSSTKPPSVERWSTVWDDPQVRNDAEVVQNALAVRDAVGDEEFLRLIAPVFGYDDSRIADILEQKAQATANIFRNLPVPGFDQLGAGNGA